jgi:hypothetical protein
VDGKREMHESDCRFTSGTSPDIAANVSSYKCASHSPTVHTARAHPRCLRAQQRIRGTLSNLLLPILFTAYVFLEVCLLGDARQSLSSVQPSLYLVVSPCRAPLVVYSVYILVYVIVRVM